MSNDSDHDLASFKASLITALMAAKNRSSGNKSFEQDFAAFDANVALSNWPLTLARKIKPDWGSWLARPWCCFQLRRLRRQLPRTDEFSQDDVDLLKLTRLLALVEFAVDVHPTWYRRLRDVSGEEGGVEPKLRRLLSSPYVWWGRADRRASNWLLKLVWQFCAMGRPAQGELHYARPQTLVIWLLLLPALLGLAFIGAALSIAFQLGTNMSSDQLATIILIAAKGGILLWAAWWFGPYGARCIRDLESIFGRGHCLPGESR